MTRGALLFHLSDIHFGGEDRAALDWVRQEVAAKKPDLVSITGDLTMRARHHEFAAAREWIESLEVPVTVDIGNHDIPNYHLPERYLQPFRRFRTFKQTVERDFALPDIALISLNSSVPAQPRMNWSKGWVSTRALDECLAAIDALPGGVLALVCVHHPLREAGTHGTAYTRNGRKALAELARRPVIGVLSGHVHDAFDIHEPTEHGPVRMIGAGTLSQRLRTTPPSFNELHWDGERLGVAVRRFGHEAPSPHTGSPVH